MISPYPHRTPAPGRRLLGSLVLLCLALLALAASASAATPPKPLLWAAPEDGIGGGGAGRVANSRGLAVDPNNGDILVSDLNNARIDEFTAWGEFVKAWGWDVAPEGAPGDTAGNELEVCTTICQAGSAGGGTGQLNLPLGIAVDSAGAVYVYERENYRVQKFDSEGAFLWMAGGGVDQGPNHPGNLCTATYITEGDTCGAGVAGSGNGQFSNDRFGNYIAVGPEGHLFVGDVGRIEELSAAGAFEGQVEGKVAGKTVGALAMDASGDFYASFKGEADVHKLDAAGAEVRKFIVPAFTGEEPQALAVDGEGNLYAVAYGNGSWGKPSIEFDQYLVEYDAAGNQLIPTAEEEAEAKKANGEGIGYGFFPRLKGFFPGLAVSDACWAPGSGLSDLYVGRFEFPTSDLHAYGPAPEPDRCPPLAQPPEVASQYATSASTDGAVVKAKINAKGSAGTTYYVEYGTGSCAAGECEATAPLPPGESLGTATSTAVTTKGIFLPELSAQTTYHFRFVAQSEGGGPAYGAAPAKGAEASFAAGLEGSFTTAGAPPLPNTECANQIFRSGPSAFLPDCRAYEMVSPLDKANGDIVTIYNEPGDHAALDQGAPGGDKLTYSSARAFADPQSAPYSSQYLAERDPEAGWLTHGISPPGGTTVKSSGQITESQFRAFTPDLCAGWFLYENSPPLSEDAPGGFFSNLYRREDCGAGGYATLSTVAPPNAPIVGFTAELQGISADGSVAAFWANDALTPDANPGVPGKETNQQCYESRGGQLRLISVLPDGTTSTDDCSLGTQNNGQRMRAASVSHAISEDGSRIFWSAKPSAIAAGPLYARIDGERTVPVSEAGEALSGKAGAGARFWAATPEGSAVLYSVGDLEAGKADLYRFDVDAETTEPIAHGVAGELGASEDLSRVYLASTEALGGAAVAGAPNLYLYEAGAGVHFIATLSEDDALATSEANVTSPLNVYPHKHVARVSADGLHAAFMSDASLTGFDNTDANSGKADAEVFVYDASAEGGAGKLLCASCNPTGVRPAGRELEFEVGPTGRWGAAKIAPWASQLYAPRDLSADGSRLFFESYEPLVGRDDNGRQDVYEWEAPGSGDCTQASASFRAMNGGCVSLVSSGQSPKDTEFVDASADGRDVFIRTSASLLPQDPGLVDIYDARAAGGFPPPPGPPAPCEGEACQGSSSAPQYPGAASAAFRGAANPVHRSARRCAKGERRAGRRDKARCVKRHTKHSKKQRRHGRAGR